MEGHVQPQALDRWTFISFTPVANTEKLRSIGQVNKIKSKTWNPTHAKVTLNTITL
jgi:hypothetical protein